MSRSCAYIIAEAGVNHNGDLNLALALIDEAADAQADAIKFQTFDANKLVNINAPKAAYQKITTDSSESQLTMLQRLELPRDWHAELERHSKKRGIDFLSTPFDFDSLSFLNNFNMRFLKVPSGELTNGPLLWAFARTHKPLILSTGMATLSEVEEALAIISHALNAGDEPKSIDEIWRYWSVGQYRASLRGHVTLMHCTSQYPTPFSEVNMRAMDTLANAFGLEVGYSDHTEGTLIPLMAVARGAKIIEKHFTLDRGMLGPDHISSIDPFQLKNMVADIRSLENAFGDGIKAPQISEWDARHAGRQQIVAARDISKDTLYKREDLTTARSGSGLPPNKIWDLIGTRAPDFFPAGTVIKESD